MMRRRVLALVAVGLLGTALELTFLEHAEDFKQWIPFAAIVLALAALAWCEASRRTIAVRSAQGAMLLLVVSGCLGVVLHYRANMEFQLESDRSLSGFALMLKVLQAKAPPALAPGTLALLGLLGLVAVRGDSSGG